MTLVRKEHLLDSWRTICDEVEYAFQPVVSTFSGQAVGFEALIRSWESAGFDSIPHLFDRATEDGVIVEVNQMLLERAAAAFAQGIAHLGEMNVSDDTRMERLFFNLDNRVFLEEYGCGALLISIRNAGLSADNVTFEISEQSALPERAYDEGQLPALRGLGIQVALDDFGAGYSGLQVLYQAGVDVVKMDRFFISGIDRDATKRIFVRNLVNMAHAMGIRVVAEGI
ncbi:MAG: EAL domain-containing protein, partial [Spirochaetales bacterium]|nr:EAL domain-containing protein [Spirochaetales bacterium]